MKVDLFLLDYDYIFKGSIVYFNQRLEDSYDLGPVM